MWVYKDNYHHITQSAITLLLAPEFVRCHTERGRAVTVSDRLLKKWLVSEAPGPLSLYRNLVLKTTTIGKSTNTFHCRNCQFVQIYGENFQSVSVPVRAGCWSLCSQPMPPQVGTGGRAGLVIQGVLDVNPVCPAYQPCILGKAVNFSELPFPCKMDLIISKA